MPRHTCYAAAWEGVPGELAQADCPACQAPTPRRVGCWYPGCDGGYVRSGGIVGMLQVCSCCGGTVHRTGDNCPRLPEPEPTT